MRSTGSIFEAYLDEAARGRESLWRLAAASLFIASSTFFVSLIIMLVAGLAALAEDRSVNGLRTWMESPALAACMLLAIGAVLPMTAIAVYVFHRRNPTGVLGPGGRLSWRQFARAFAITAVVIATVNAVGLAISPRIERSSLAFGGWLLQAPLFGGLILLQSAAEEYLFRGYLVQTLARRFGNPIVWCGAPATLFGLMHWNPSLNSAMNVGTTTAMALFAVAATLLVVRTGNLGASIGLHFANNLVYLLIISEPAWSRPIALYLSPAIASEGWATPSALIVGALSLAAIPVATTLLLHRRSPFNITSGAQALARPAQAGAHAVQEREGGTLAEL